MTLSWGHSTTITWTSDSKTLNMIDNKDNFYETFGDISATIKKRVLNKYGLQVNDVLIFYYYFQNVYILL